MVKERRKERLVLLLSPEINEKVRENAKKYGLSNSAYAGFVIADYFANIERLKEVAGTMSQRVELETRAMEMMAGMVAEMKKMADEVAK